MYREIFLSFHRIDIPGITIVHNYDFFNENIDRIVKDLVPLKNFMSKTWALGARAIVRARLLYTCVCILMLHKNIK